MKRSNFTLKLMCYLIFAALLVWLGIYAFQAMDNPTRTVPVVSCTDRETIELNGIVAREESVLYSGYDAVQVALAEGQRVSAGGTVARAYASQELLQRAVRLSELEKEAAELNALLADNVSDSTRQTDAEIQSGIRSLRQAAYKGEFAEAGSLCQSLQTQVFAAFSSTADILSRLNRCNGEIQQLQSQGVSSSAVISAPVPGLFSSSVDGWESLSSSDLSRIEPGALQSLLREQRSEPEAALGKLVSGIRWYYAALMDAEQMDELRGKKTVQVVFGRYYGEELEMRLEWISNERDGLRTVVLSCGEAMGEMLSARKQSAQLVLRELSGLRVPRKSIHVDEAGNTFVYVQTGLQLEKKPVTILRDYDEYYMVESDTLRLGDEVLVSGKNLFPGKVVG